MLIKLTNPNNNNIWINPNYIISMKSVKFVCEKNTQTDIVMIEELIEVKETPEQIIELINISKLKEQELLNINRIFTMLRFKY